MKNERAKEILDCLVCQVRAFNDAAYSIDKLIKFGFYGEDLVNDYGFFRPEVEGITGKPVALLFTDSFDMTDSICVVAEISASEVAQLFKLAKKVPKNDNVEDDDTYTCGEIIFRFNNRSMDFEEVLLYPSYEDKEGSICNGDFIELPWDEEYRDFQISKAKEYLISN